MSFFIFRKDQSKLSKRVSIYFFIFFLMEFESPSEFKMRKTILLFLFLAIIFFCGSTVVLSSSKIKMKQKKNSKGKNLFSLFSSDGADEEEDLLDDKVQDSKRKVKTVGGFVENGKNSNLDFIPDGKAAELSLDHASLTVENEKDQLVLNFNGTTILEEDFTERELAMLEQMRAQMTEKKSGKLNADVYQRGLVDTKISARSILNEYEAYYEATHRRSMDCLDVPITLGFVTPWNGKGYDIAKDFAGKFTHLSPVWYQIRRSKEDQKIVLTGGHDVDQEWISIVRSNSVYEKTDNDEEFFLRMDALRRETQEACDNEGICEESPIIKEQQDTSQTPVKIVPRVILEIDGTIDPQDLYVIERLLAEEVVKYQYDGFVLEWPIVPGIDSFIRELRNTLGNDASLFIAVPSWQMPLGGTPTGYHANPSLLKEIAQSVNGIIIVGYDYPGHKLDPEQRKKNNPFLGVPNSPMTWIVDNIRRLVESADQDEDEVLDNITKSSLKSKLVLSLPFYGYDNGRPILSHEFASILEKAKVNKLRHKFDQKAIEHEFRYTDNQKKVHRVTYPTLYMLHDRLRTAEDLGLAGISIWELGQGMPYFMDVL